ncbi:MAG: hypothetical protein AAFY59_20590, partial [Pseudomonadota bacterium]
AGRPSRPRHPRSRSALAEAEAHGEAALKLIDKGDWPGLDAYLAAPKLDQPHTLAMSLLDRIFECVWEDILTDHVDAQDIAHPAAARDLPDAALAPFRTAIAAGNLPHLSLLTAHLLISMGWARRGGLFARDPGFDPLSEQARYFREAQTLLDNLPETLANRAATQRLQFSTRAGPARV